MGRVMRLPRLQAAWQLIEREGGPTGLTLNTRARLPVLRSPTQVLVRVRAASVNPLDVMMSQGYGREVLGLAGQAQARSKGFQPVEESLPRVLGTDFSGEVVSVGPG